MDKPRTIAAVLGLPTIEAIQLSKIRAPILGGFGAAGLVILAITAFGLISGTRLDHLTIDPADVLMMPAYYGVLSHLGVMAWSASAAVSLLASLLMTGPERRGRRVFLRASGAVSAMLMLDDALLLHDRVFPEVIGIPETLVYGIYLLIILTYLFKSLRLIMQTDFLLLAIGVSLLSVSVAMDRILPVVPLETFIEDSLKFAGIIFWMIYFFRTSIAACHSLVSPSTVQGREMETRLQAVPKKKVRQISADL